MFHIFTENNSQTTKLNRYLGLKIILDKYFDTQLGTF